MPLASSEVWYSPARAPAVRLRAAAAKELSTSSFVMKGRRRRPLDGRGHESRAPRTGQWASAWTRPRAADDAGDDSTPTGRSARETQPCAERLANELLG